MSKANGILRILVGKIHDLCFHLNFFSGRQAVIKRHVVNYPIHEIYNPSEILLATTETGFSFDLSTPRL